MYGYDQRVEVFGAAGIVVVSNNVPDAHVLSGAQGVHAALPLYFFMRRYTGSFITEMTGFMPCLQKDAAPPVTGRDGRAPVVIGLAAQQSLRENRPIRVGEFG